MYCPLKLPFFIKKCPLKLHNLLYIFICINTFLPNINVQQTVLYPTIYPSGIPSSRHDMNFVPVIPRVKVL